MNERIHGLSQKSVLAYNYPAALVKPVLFAAANHLDAAMATKLARDQSLFAISRSAALLDYSL
jgi:hypothetical protein